MKKIFTLLFLFSNCMMMAQNGDVTKEFQYPNFIKYHQDAKDTDPGKTDLTAEYRNALQRLTGGLETGREELQTVMGHDTFNESLEHRKDQIDAINRGLLVREMYIAQAV